MPNLTSPAVGPEKRLQEFLGETFRGSEADVRNAGTVENPLLLLQYGRELTGFGVSNGDARKSFEQSLLSL
jgi:hypothetical protein